MCFTSVGPVLQYSLGYTSAYEVSPGPGCVFGEQIFPSYLPHNGFQSVCPKLRADLTKSTVQLHCGATQPNNAPMTKGISYSSAGTQAMHKHLNEEHTLLPDRTEQTVVLS